MMARQPRERIKKWRLNDQARIRRRYRETDRQRLDAATMTTALIRARVSLLTSQVHNDLRRLEEVLDELFAAEQRKK